MFNLLLISALQQKLGFVQLGFTQTWPRWGELSLATEVCTRSWEAENSRRLFARESQAGRHAGSYQQIRFPCERAQEGGHKARPRSRGPEIWLPNCSVDNLGFVAINVSRGSISLLTRRAGYKTLRPVVSPPTVGALFHRQQAALSPPVLNTLNACWPHTDLTMSQQKNIKKKKKKMKKI